MAHRKCRLGTLLMLRTFHNVAPHYLEILMALGNNAMI